MQVMLLAAGLGTRLRPYTHFRPKPLFPVLNVPLLHVLLDQLAAAGCGRVVVNAHHLAEQIEAAVADRPEVILQYEPEILGTGGSLRRALPLFADEPILVMNGDIYHDIDLAALLQQHAAAGLPVSMAMHDYDRFNSVAVRSGLVRGFSGNREDGGGELLAFTGLHVLAREVIELIPDSGFFHIIDLYETLAAAGRIGCHRVDGSFWCDIGTPEDYLDLHRQLLNGGRGNRCGCGSGGSDSWCISSKAEIADDVRFDDWGAVGPGVKICSGSRLRRCVVWEDVKVAPGSQLVDSIVHGVAENL